MAEESTGTVLLAGAANLAIATAKTIGGLISGSTAMLAEAAHSVADTLNQAFLLAALKRSRKPADMQHPFGYGMERYFWSLLAAVGIFVLGAGYSVYQGVRAILEPEKLTSLVVAYVVLGVSFVFEGVSWLKAVVQVRREARQRERGTLEHLRRTPDPTAKTVAFEDTAALAGIVLAALGVTLRAVTGQGFWDGGASVAIGLLLIGVAYALGRQNKAFLIGQSASEELRRGIGEEIEKAAGVDHVLEVLTMQLAPDEVLVAARVNLADKASGGDLEQHADEIDSQVRKRYPEVRHIFLDPTDAPREASASRDSVA